jgi:hypothetical protein
MEPSSLGGLAISEERSLIFEAVSKVSGEYFPNKMNSGDPVKLEMLKKEL